MEIKFWNQGEIKVKKADITRSVGYRKRGIFVSTRYEFPTESYAWLFSEFQLACKRAVREYFSSLGLPGIISLRVDRSRYDLDGDLDGDREGEESYLEFRLVHSVTSDFAAKCLLSVDKLESIVKTVFFSDECLGLKHAWVAADAVAGPIRKAAEHEKHVSMVRDYLWEKARKNAKEETNYQEKLSLLERQLQEVQGREIRDLGEALLSDDDVKDGDGNPISEKAIKEGIEKAKSHNSGYHNSGRVVTGRS